MASKNPLFGPKSGGGASGGAPGQNRAPLFGPGGAPSAAPKPPSNNPLMQQQQPNPALSQRSNLLNNALGPNTSSMMGGMNNNMQQNPNSMFGGSSSSTAGVGGGFGGNNTSNNPLMRGNLNQNPLSGGMGNNPLGGGGNRPLGGAPLGGGIQPNPGQMSPTKNIGQVINRQGGDLSGANAGLGSTTSQPLMTDQCWQNSPYPAILAKNSTNTVDNTSSLLVGNAPSSSSTAKATIAPTLLEYQKFYGISAEILKYRKALKKTEWFVFLGVLPLQEEGSSGGESGAKLEDISLTDDAKTTAEESADLLGGTDSPKGTERATAATDTSPAKKSPRTLQEAWTATLSKLRNEYKQIKEMYKIDLQKTVAKAGANPTKFNPLSKAQDNPWEQIGEDEELMNEILKDVERTYCVCVNFLIWINS